MADRLTRRQFVRNSAWTAAAMAAGLTATKTVWAGNPHGEDTSKILNYNQQMEYRRCGKTGMMVSAVALGGHWKRLVKVIGGTEPEGWMTQDIEREDFQKNRREIVSRCIDRGINYVDACCREEILAYSKALQGRRDKMYVGYSWHVKESRFQEWRSRKKLKEGLDEGMREAGLDYVDLWRISLLVDSQQHTPAELDDVADALDWAKKTGRAQFHRCLVPRSAASQAGHRDISRTSRGRPDPLYRQDQGGYRRGGVVGVHSEARSRLVWNQAVREQLDLPGRQCRRQSSRERRQRNGAAGYPLHSLQSRHHGTDGRPDHAPAGR